MFYLYTRLCSLASLLSWQGTTCTSNATDEDLSQPPEDSAVGLCSSDRKKELAKTGSCTARTALYGKMHTYIRTDRQDQTEQTQRRIDAETRRQTFDIHV